MQAVRLPGSSLLIAAASYLSGETTEMGEDGRERRGAKSSVGPQCAADHVEPELGFEPRSPDNSPSSLESFSSRMGHPLHLGHFTYERKQVNFQFYT